jgi:hypothetical protein
MAEEVMQVELQAWDWMGAVAQKIEKMRERVFEHKDIPEEYVPLMKYLYRGWRNMEYPIYETKVSGIAETTVQNSLFGQIDSKKPTGKVLAEVVLEPIKTE